MRERQRRGLSDLCRLRKMNVQYVNSGLLQFELSPRSSAFTGFFGCGGELCVSSPPQFSRATEHAYAFTANRRRVW